MKQKRLVFPLVTLLLFLSSCQLGKTEEVLVNPDQAAINTHLQQGEQLYHNQEYQAAHQAFSTILALDGGYIDAYIRRAQVNIKLKAIPNAEKDLLQAKTLLADQDSAIFHEANAEYQLEKRNDQEAMQAIERAIALEPSNRRTAIQGNVYYRLHEHAKAKQQLLRALQDETDSERAMYVYILTELAIYEGDYPQAISYLDQLQAMDTAQSKYHAMQGYVYGKQLQATSIRAEQEQLHTQSAAQVELAWQKDPTMEDAITNNYLGLHYYLTNDATAALKYYDAAIALEPTYAVFYNNRALVYYAEQHIKT